MDIRRTIVPVLCPCHKISSSSPVSCTKRKGKRLSRPLPISPVFICYPAHSPGRKTKMSSSSALPSFGSPASPLQATGMLSREQLIHLFNRFSFLTSQPDVKKRISDAVKDKQETVAVTTAIQEEILLEMGIDPRFGIACLGKVNMVYENDRDLMIRFYGFVAKEEVACDEAELEPDEFAEKLHIQQKMQEKQLEMLKHMRKFHLDDQPAILETLHRQMENANFDVSAAVLTSEQIEEIVRTRVKPFRRAIK